MLRIFVLKNRNALKVYRAEVWLKDRKGRTLSYDDITHYQKIVVALKETLRLMTEIDQIIPRWPLE